MDYCGMHENEEGMPLFGCLQWEVVSPFLVEASVRYVNITIELF